MKLILLFLHGELCSLGIIHVMLILTLVTRVENRTTALNYAAIIMHSSCALIDTSKVPESSSTNFVSINYVFKTNTE